MSRPPLEVADIIRSRREAFERQSRGWINGQLRKVLDTSPAISANAHEVGRMTLHPQHRRNCLAHNQQEIPAFDLSGRSDVDLGVLDFASSAASAGQISSDSLTEQMNHQASMPHGVLPAPFKLHKPPQLWRLPSSRCT